MTRSARLGLNTIVFGARGSGKTSLLRHATWSLRTGQRDERGGGAPEAWRIVHVTAADVEDPDQLLHRLVRRVTGDSVAAGSTHRDPLVLLERLGAALAPSPGVENDSPRTVVVLDDLPALLGRALFGALRDELWRLDVTWVVACADTEVDALLLPPVDAFFETVIPLGGLDVDSAIALVLRRLVAADQATGKVSEQDLRQLAEISKGNPRRLIDQVRAVLVDGTPVPALLSQLETRYTRLDLVSRGAAMLAAELDSLGAVSPSDPQLQHRMGVSRPRLVRLFGELKEAGLAEETAAAPAGPGRPRVLYRLVATNCDDMVTAAMGEGS